MTITTQMLTIFKKSGDLQHYNYVACLRNFVTKILNLILIGFDRYTVVIMWEMKKKHNNVLQLLFLRQFLWKSWIQFSCRVHDMQNDKGKYFNF